MEQWPWFALRLKSWAQGRAWEQDETYKLEVFFLHTIPSYLVAAPDSQGAEIQPKQLSDPQVESYGKNLSISPFPQDD